MKKKQQRQTYLTDNPAHIKSTLILKRFRDLGLSAYEAKSYLSLLQRQTLTVTEVAKLAGIPRTNAYDALEKLMTKGMCISKPGHVKKYSASDPSVLQEELLTKATAAAQAELAQVHEKEKQMLAKHQNGIEKLKRREREILQKYQAAKQSELRKLNEKKREIREKAESVKRNMANVVAELKPQYDTSRLETNPLDYIEIVKDPYQIHKRYMQLVGGAKEEILVFSKPPYAGDRKTLEEQFECWISMLDRGVRARSVIEIPKEEEERKWVLQRTQLAVSRGEESRVKERLPMKMAVFDSKTVILALEDPVSKHLSLTTQIVEHRSLAESLKILFETVWEQAEDYHILGDSRG
jgi:sugar-specific transcriptional regulator TrmB